MEKVGFIFECGRDGPDFKVIQHFLGRLNPKIRMEARFLDNKRRLLEDCGAVAARLIRDDKCSRVVVTWDLVPAWGGTACRHDDRELASASLAAAGVPPDRTLLLCVERELECWLMADSRALKSVLAKFKHPHEVGDFVERKMPDRQIGRPKTELIGLFVRELGRGRKYVDRDHALVLAQAVPDWTRLRRSVSFCRFATKVAGKTL